MFSFFNRKPKEPAKLCFSTDIHCHVVPGVDDGSPDAACSADLIERMQGWGIKRIIASPHVTLSTFENTPATLDPAMELLAEELRKRGNSIPVGHWAEYRLDDLFTARFEARDLMTLPDDYILVENSFMQEPWNFDQLVFDIQVAGYRPVFAHPERYSYYHGHMSRYRRLHKAGLLFQINLLSLAGAYGEKERKAAEELIADGIVDFIGTDLHNHRHADAIDAYLTTKEAHRHMLALAGMVRNDIVFPS